MPKSTVVKRNRTAGAEAFILPPAEELGPLPEPEPEPLTPESAEFDLPEDLPEALSEEPPEAPPEPDPISYAKIQAEAILADARREAEAQTAAYQEEARRAFEAELDQVRTAARQEGYSRGYALGMADAAAEARRQREELAAAQIEDVRKFLEDAARERDRLFDENRQELKDLAVAIAEKVIRVSLKNSTDIILRMVDAATDTHKRCEWAHIYVADCDVKGKAYTVPELTAALKHISERVRVIPMADDESGTCIVEMPDVIMDASVSTQLENIREILNSTSD